IGAARIEGDSFRQAHPAGTAGDVGSQGRSGRAIVAYDGGVVSPGDVEVAVGAEGQAVGAADATAARRDEDSVEIASRRVEAEDVVVVFLADVQVAIAPGHVPPAGEPPAGHEVL